MSISRAPARDAYTGVVCVLFGSIGFSGKTVIVKAAYQYGVDAMTLLALRMLFALPLFLIMMWLARDKTAVTRRDLWAVATLGFIGYYLGSYLDFAGLRYISAGLGRLILYLYPTLVLLLSALVLKQRIRGVHLVSLALSYGGIALVFQHEARLGDDMRLMALGTLLVFAGAVCYAVYLVAGSNIVRRLGATRLTAFGSLAATVFVMAHFFAIHEPAQLVVAHQVYWLTLIMAIFSTVLPLWLLAEGLKRIGANQVALVACIGPISTIALAHVFLGEPVTASQIMGAALVLAGVMIISFRPQAAKALPMEPKEAVSPP